jgi:hypothetical protein
LFPDLGVAGDRVDDPRRHRFADLAVAIAWMVIIAPHCPDLLGLVWGRAGTDIRLLLGGIGVAATEVENPAVRRKRASRHVGEEIIEAAEIALELGVIRDVAKKLRSLVMTDVTVVRGGGSVVRRLAVVAFLVPAPSDQISIMASYKLNIPFDAGQIIFLVEILAHHCLRVAPEKSER